MSERKEKIETKGAYSHDLHEAIRDVRRALANNNHSQVGSRLKALYDICAPEIRKAVNEEWLKIEKKYQKELELYRNAEYRVTSFHRKEGWEEKLDGGHVCNIYVKNPMTHFNERRIERETRDSYLGKVWDKIYHERFRACIDCLDEHGELRKWREVEYGKL